MLRPGIQPEKNQNKEEQSGSGEPAGESGAFPQQGSAENSKGARGNKNTQGCGTVPTVTQRLKTAADMKAGITNPGGSGRGQRNGRETPSEGGQPAAQGRYPAGPPMPVGQQADGHLQGKGTEVVEQHTQPPASLSGQTGKHQQRTAEIHPEVARSVEHQMFWIYEKSPPANLAFWVEHGPFVYIDVKRRERLHRKNKKGIPLGAECPKKREERVSAGQNRPRGNYLRRRSRRPDHRRSRLPGRWRNRRPDHRKTRRPGRGRCRRNRPLWGR